MGCTVQVVEVLLADHRTDPNLGDLAGVTPLHLAVLLHLPR